MSFQNHIENRKQEFWLSCRVKSAQKKSLSFPFNRVAWVVKNFSSQLHGGRRVTMDGVLWDLGSSVRHGWPQGSVVPRSARPGYQPIGAGSLDLRTACDLKTSETQPAWNTPSFSSQFDAQGHGKRESFKTVRKE